MPKNTKKITKELCSKNNLLFLPETKEETSLVQKKLLEMGFVWANGSRSVTSIDQCFQFGIVLLNSKIYYRGEADKTDYLLCTLSQFGTASAPLLTAEEQISLMKQFNDLSAIVQRMSEKMDGLEKKVDMICNEIQPKRIDKGGLKGNEPKT